MLASLLAVALLPAQRPSNEIRLMPSANVQVLFSRDFELVALTQFSKAHGLSWCEGI
jgi:hypothetical protein